MELPLLSCPLCLNPHFKSVDSLRTSLITIANSNIVCPICNQVFLGLDKLTIHLFSHITDEKFITQNTESVTNSAQVDTKINKTDNVRNKKKCIRCDICSYHFSDEIVLDLHQKLLHQTVPDKTTGEYSYHCHLCSKQFKKRGSLMVHLRVVHFGFIQHNQRVCNCSDTKSVKKNGASLSEQFKCLKQKPTNNSTQENKQWECDICLKLFTTKYFLKKHKRLHTGEMPYYCSQCNKYFTFQQSYHKHMLYHSDDKPYVCTECGRSFKELSTLHNHQRIHSGERPFSCETCGKCFRQRVSYLVHRRIHTGVMPYKCTACNKRFRYKVSQHSHKCPVDPPGTVIRTPDSEYKLIETQNENIEKINDISEKNQNLKTIASQDRNLSLDKVEKLSIHNGVPPFYIISNVNVPEVSNKNGRFQCTISHQGNTDVDPLQSATKIGLASVGNSDVSPNLGECIAVGSDSKMSLLNMGNGVVLLQTINQDSIKELIYGSSSIENSTVT